MAPMNQIMCYVCLRYFYPLHLNDVKVVEYSVDKGIVESEETELKVCNNCAKGYEK